MWEGFSPVTDIGSSGDRHNPKLIEFSGALLTETSQRLYDLPSLFASLQSGEDPSWSFALRYPEYLQLVSSSKYHFILPEAYANVLQSCSVTLGMSFVPVNLPF